MAKISAHNAREIDRVSKASEVYVYTSDGRVLRKWRYDDGTWTGFTIVKTHVGTIAWEYLKLILRGK